MTGAPETDLVAIRAAVPSDATAIAGVHVASWRSAYAGILPNHSLTGLSIPRQAGYYGRLIGDGQIVRVAEARSGAPVSGLVVGFVTARRISRAVAAEGEIETLYVLDDWRERGIGRRLIQSAGAALKAAGCRSAFVWVLSENPNRWFYERLGGVRMMEGQVGVGGVAQPQTAYRWDPIEILAEAQA
ncbi:MULTISPECIES: GNAT family N-acetyltransferase [unclassified Acidisoma]|jgi:ribosomal protein S18 acetylase RimI-like enzyme|uniref:GNAT family N-acetyltransferase n=1 Tax=unclassified Acidisoma TaxID=2634065 RepID=UPI00131DE5CE|nr:MULTISPECIES: GNAT family N-acetyltransferase [unclassified Acidisoma]